MFTSFVQYLLIAPSYINIINVYAFCNVQDVSRYGGGCRGWALTSDLGSLARRSLGGETI